MSKKDSNKKVEAKNNDKASKKAKVCPIKVVGAKTCNLYKKCNLSKKQKAIIILILAVLAGLGYYAYCSLTTKVHKTEIHTPVISRTEISKKPSIQIKVFDKKAEDALNAETTKTEIKDVKEGKTAEVKKADSADSKKTETKEASKTTEPALTELSTKVSSLETAVKALEKLNEKSIKLDELNSRITKLENLEGTVGKMSNIFLAQQLVLLDNAFKVGGNYNIAIKNIQEFAKTKAKNEKVAQKLSELLDITQEQAIVTPQALLFYAKKLETIKLNFPKKEEVKAEGFFNKVKAMLRSFISVRKSDEVKAEQELWNTKITNLEESIIFADLITTQKILDNEKLQELGGEDFTNFAKLFKTYLVQQQALQAVLGTFIEGYNYDY